MKNGISRIFTQGMAVLVAALMACGTSPTSISRAPRSEANRYDGETLFRGLFFGIGPVADLFPEIWDSSIVRNYKESGQFLPETQSKAIENISAKMVQNDPDFFARFSNDVQSGDRVRIENAIKDTAQRLYAMVSDETSFVSGGEGVYRTLTVAVDIAAAVEVAAALVLVVAVAVAVLLVLVLGAGEDNTSASNLKREFWIDLMADRLGPDGAPASN